MLCEFNQNLHFFPFIHYDFDANLLVVSPFITLGPTELFTLKKLASEVKQVCQIELLGRLISVPTCHVCLSV